MPISCYNTVLLWYLQKSYAISRGTKLPCYGYGLNLLFCCLDICLGWVSFCWPELNLVWLFQIQAAHCELIFRLFKVKCRFGLNYRALENVHSSPAPLPPSPTTLTQSLSTPQSVPTAQLKGSLLQIVTIGWWGQESFYGERAPHRPADCALLSCTLSSHRLFHRAAHRRTPLSLSYDPRNLILLPNKSKAAGKQICPARANIVKMTTHSTLTNTLFFINAEGSNVVKNGWSSDKLWIHLLTQL